MVNVPGVAAVADCVSRPEESGSAAAPASCSTLRRERIGETMTGDSTKENGARERAPLMEGVYSAACGALSAQRAINVLDGKLSSTSFFAVGTPAVGGSAGSSRPLSKR